MKETTFVKLTNTDWVTAFEAKHASVYTLAESGFILCVLQKEYIPIVAFKELFEKITELISAGKYHRFIFDKRKLSAFHQPSMEWYYLEWKASVLPMGIKEHRKLLPEANWFRKTVEIAKIGLEKRMPEELRNGLDIQYCESIEEATTS
ncbi:MAG TPA: hypothetical protein DCE41_06975 [Cytophagales bacterium]|nr:hypothetical protein [Cytophagales bacterium]HAA22043.1 hypothetical protein [Cytophagales bacterium]HAP58586.1 hypothetical protein [Cytophagales bacterium]